MKHSHHACICISKNQSLVVAKRNFKSTFKKHSVTQESHLQAACKLEQSQCWWRLWCDQAAAVVATAPNPEERNSVKAA